MLLVLATACATALLTAPASADVRTLRKDSPEWYTSTLHQKVLAAGAQGVRVGAEYLNTECPGYQERGVAANGCIVAPYGCTANFIFTDSASYYIGTARHCVDKTGQTVVMQVDTTMLAAVGTVAKHTSGDGDVGNDFALIQLDPAVVAKWGVVPGLLGGGPRGVYDGCAPQPVKHYGHGYGVAVAQGKPQAGLATNWYDDGYGWTGYGIFGDSGSGVVLADGRAAGNFTHLIVDSDYPGSDLAGMRLTAILRFAGVSLVNADGSTSSGPTTTVCGGAESSGGGPGGNGGGKGGGKGGGEKSR